MKPRARRVTIVAAVLGAGVVGRLLESNKIRVLEQRFPRRAFVVFHDPGP